MKDYSLCNDNELIQLIKTNDTNALNELTQRCLTVATRLAGRFHIKDFELSDLVQESMLIFPSVVSTYSEDKGASFRTYFSVCIRNKLISLSRSAARKEDVSFVGFDEIPEITVDEDNPEDTVISECFLTEFENELKEILSPCEMKVITLYIKGCSYKTIAEMTGLTAKAVDGAMQRCRRKIKNKLHPEA